MRWITSKFSNATSNAPTWATTSSRTPSVCRLAAAIEAVAATSATFREEVFGPQWKIIWATRNRIAHGYAFIDLNVIRNTVEHDLPEFEQNLRRSLP